MSIEEVKSIIDNQLIPEEYDRPQELVMTMDNGEREWIDPVLKAAVVGGQLVIDNGYNYYSYECEKIKTMKFNLMDLTDGFGDVASNGLH